MKIEDNYFENIPEDRRRDIAFNTLVLIRDTLDIARHSNIPTTYEQAFNVAHDINPGLYTFCTEQLTKKNENDTVKLFKERAEAETIKQGKTITATDLLNSEVKEFTTLLKTPGLEKEKTRFLKNHIISLQAALENLKPRKLSEHRILERDFCKIDRQYLGAEKHFETDNYIDYKISENKYLRIRLLHPDKPEHVLGVDLIYEQFDVESEKIRIAVLQYKTWNKDTLYINNSNNIESQLVKMKTNICDYGLCSAPSIESEYLEYRFPYCCAFLRPTDKMQNADSKLISHGIHLPVCLALQIKNNNGNKIEKKKLKQTSISHELFEKLFNQSFLGSRWMEWSKLEDFYKDKNVLNPDESLKLYAKEIIGKKTE